jgi:V-type H+-transporting ATPase subunit H
MQVYETGEVLTFIFCIHVRQLEKVGAKQKIMELMTHQDQQVRYQALTATQKYFAMVS